jgi:hypothetical protein
MLRGEVYNNLWSFEIVFNNKHDSDKFSRHINRAFTYLLACLLACIKHAS